MSIKCLDSDIKWDTVGKIPEIFLETRSRTATEK
jgi:hypothetical protein